MGKKKALLKYANPNPDSALQLLLGRINLLNEVWHVYSALVIRKTGVSILNKRGGYVFQLWVAMSGDWLITEICKILDPPSSMGRDNLTLEKCINNLSGTTEFLASDEKRARAKLKQIRMRFETIRTHRNRRTAHIDYEATIPKEYKVKPGQVVSVSTLPLVQRREIGYAVGEIVRLFKLLFMTRYNFSLVTDDSSQGHRAVKELLQLLKVGNAALDNAKSNKP
jgi:hypothetical protein